MTIHRHTTKKCPVCRKRYLAITRHGDPLGINPPTEPRFPWHPIAAILIDRHEGNVPYAVATPYGQAKALRTIYGLNCHPTEIRKWIRNGLALHTADRIAVTLGHHPVDLWVGYWDIAFRVCDVIGEPEEAAA